MAFTQEFWGYRRPDGQIGIRNRLAVIAAMDNVNPVARRIASLVRGAVARYGSFRARTDRPGQVPS